MQYSCESAKGISEQYHIVDESYLKSTDAITSSQFIGSPHKQCVCLYFRNMKCMGNIEES